MNNKKLHMAAYTLMWVGGLNWGLVGLLNFNLVSSLFGAGSALERLVYLLVGTATLYTLVSHKGYCKHCSTSV